MEGKDILMDVSWSGMGGIGRFTDEIAVRAKGISFSRICIQCASPMAPLWLSLNMLLKRKVDLFFFPGYIPPLLGFKKYVFTIHDLNHIDLSDNSSFIKRAFYNFVIKRGCKKASKILTVSEFSKSRIAEWSGVEPNKIVTVYNGVSENFNIGVEPFNPGFEYLLCVGNRKTHKNEMRVVAAFAKARINHSIKLVFTGHSSPELISQVEQYGLTDRIVFNGFVAEEDLPSLYKGSLGLIFPSLYEGFGLPVIEAMACGVPVLTSTVSSLPEVAGDAAILVNPLSIDEISTGITHLVNDTKLRNELISRGIYQSKKFSWQSVVEKIEKTLAEA